MLTHIKYGAAIVTILTVCGMMLGWQRNEVNKARKAEDAAKSELVAAKNAVKIVERVKEVEKRVYLKAKDEGYKIIQVETPVECDAIVEPWRDGINRVRQEAVDAESGNPSDIQREMP